MGIESAAGRRCAVRGGEPPPGRSPLHGDDDVAMRPRRTERRLGRKCGASWGNPAVQADYSAQMGVRRERRGWRVLANA
jgi:hypothetical protein